MQFVHLYFQCSALIKHLKVWNGNARDPLTQGNRFDMTLFCKLSWDFKATINCIVNDVEIERSTEMGLVDLLYAKLA